MGVVASRHPLRSALWLVLALSATALCYLVLDASFVAAAQVVVYVGAVAVLIVFAIMLLRMKGGSLDRREAPQRIVAATIGAGLLMALLPVSRNLASAPALPEGFGDARTTGRFLLSPEGGLLPFELVSILLLAAMVGAIVLGRKTS